MKYHINFNGQIVASFINERQRDDVLKYWKERFSYAAGEIIAVND